MTLDRTTEQLRAEVPYFIASAIVDSATGRSLVSTTNDPGFDPAVASPSYAEVVRANARALDLLGLDPNSTEDILITTTGAYLIIRLYETGHYHGLAIAKQANLAFTRVIMRKYAPVFVNLLRAHRI